MNDQMNDGSNPDALFRAGKQAEKKRDWEKATEYFNKATEAYKKEIQFPSSMGRLKEENIIYYLRSRINALLNLFRFEFEDTDEFAIDHANQKISFYQRERRELLSEFPHIFEHCSSVERSFFNKLEESLSINGLKSESSQICYLSQQLETEILLEQRKQAYRDKKIFLWIKNEAQYIFRNLFFNLYLGYGVKVGNLVVSAILIIIAFGLLYSLTHCIEITKMKDSFNPLKGLFASVMTFIGFDFDEVAPICNWGRVLVSLEGILGFITFGGIIAYIWRKLK